jgi:hypothetical protein
VRGREEGVPALQGKLAQQGAQEIPSKRVIAVQNIQSVGIFQYKIFCQYGCFSTKYEVSRDISAPIIQSVGIFQYKIFS